jgi:hypothetical protein
VAGAHILMRFSHSVLLNCFALEVDYLKTGAIKISVALCVHYLHCLEKFNKQFHGKSAATAARFEACLIYEMSDEEQ